MENQMTPPVALVPVISFVMTSEKVLSTKVDYKVNTNALFDFLFTK